MTQMRWLVLLSTVRIGSKKQSTELARSPFHKDYDRIIFSQSFRQLNRKTQVHPQTQHDGIHTFYVGKNARVKYVEKHYGDGDGKGERVMNPTTIVEIASGGYMEMETTQIKGIDSTKRVTEAKLADDATFIVREKLMTHGKQYAETGFEVELNGENSSTNVISRAVARDTSKQLFLAKIRGNNKCHGHSECDAIIMDDAKISAIPEITANHLEANLIHEAAIGKIAGEQLIKLMTLGLTEKEAETQIVNGFLK